MKIAKVESQQKSPLNLHPIKVRKARTKIFIKEHSYTNSFITKGILTLAQKAKRTLTPVFKTVNTVLRGAGL